MLALSFDISHFQWLLNCCGLNSLTLLLPNRKLTTTIVERIRPRCRKMGSSKIIKTFFDHGSDGDGSFFFRCKCSVGRCCSIKLTGNEHNFYLCCLGTTKVFWLKLCFPSIPLFLFHSISLLLLVLCSQLNSCAMQQPLNYSLDKLVKWWMCQKYSRSLINLE